MKSISLQVTIARSGCSSLVKLGRIEEVLLVRAHYLMLPHNS